MTSAAIRKILSSGDRYGYFIAGTGQARGMTRTPGEKLRIWLRNRNRRGERRWQGGLEGWWEL